MSFNDIRYNNYQIIDYNSTDNKWSKNWDDFSGLSYLPVVTEWETWAFRTLNFTAIHEFMQNKWHYSIYASVLYMIMIVGLKQWMAIRGRPYDLRQFLIVWNSFLAIFSIIGVIRCLPEFYNLWLTKGFNATFCESDFYRDQRLVWWYILFTWSKVIELIDTLFIILRNGKLIKLHWIHHILTLCYSWYVFGNVPATGRWMTNMNLIAHSFMYTYYALKALRLSIPLVISISITSIQILQMVFGLYINYKVIDFKRTGTPCDASLSVVVSGLSLYLLFFFLFANFFIKTYLFKPKHRSSKKVESCLRKDLTIIDNQIKEKNV